MYFHLHKTGLVIFYTFHENVYISTSLESELDIVTTGIN